MKQQNAPVTKSGPCRMSNETPESPGLSSAILAVLTAISSAPEIVEVFNIKMKSEEAFAKFVKGALVPAKARRYLALYGSKKGQAKILADLYHGFDDAVKAEVVRAGEKAGRGASG